ncbi:MAG: hypothetical protein Q9219_006282 [cf. Caloplaca sp. 3 TL-2023]
MPHQGRATSPSSKVKTRARELQKTLHRLHKRVLTQPNLGSAVERARPRVRRYWHLPRIESPYPVIKAREPAIDPSLYVSQVEKDNVRHTLTSHRLSQAKHVERLMVQFSGLSLTDRLSTPSAAWCSLERLPPEMIASIASHLAFWDKKALASTSQRMYDVLGPVKPPDRFSWKIHILTAFNRVPNEYFDITYFKPDQISCELVRIQRQLPSGLRRGHYVFDPSKTRLKDLNCLYFPLGFQTRFQDMTVRCLTLGQFIAIQINLYIRRLLTETLNREFTAVEGVSAEVSTKAVLKSKADGPNGTNKWEVIREDWMNVEYPSRPALEIPWKVYTTSAWDESIELMKRMGYDFIRGQFCLHGRLCQIEDSKTNEECDNPIIAGGKKRSLEMTVDPYDSEEL